MLPYSCPSPFWSHLFVGLLLSACSSMHAPVHMLPSLDKCIIHNQIIRQLINYLFTLPCKLKNSNVLIFFNIDCFCLHAPIFTPLTFLVKLFHRHAPVSILQSACSRQHATNILSLYKWLNKYLIPCSQFHANWEKIECHFFKIDCSDLHATLLYFIH